MAQRQRAGLITPRSHDRNMLSVLKNNFIYYFFYFYFTKIIYFTKKKLIKNENNLKICLLYILPTWRRGSARGS